LLETQLAEKQDDNTFAFSNFCGVCNPSASYVGSLRLAIRKITMIEGVIKQMTLEDGRILAIAPLTFGRARLTIGTDELQYSDGW